MPSPHKMLTATAHLALLWCGLGAGSEISQRAAPKHNAFVSFATGYKLNALWAVMRPFMHYTDSTDDIVLFVSDSTAREFEARKANHTTGVHRPESVVLLSEDAYLKGFTGNDDFVKARFGWLAPWHKRMFAIRNWLTTASGRYNKILICDARDIAFQRNPFEDPMTPQTLFVFSETQLCVHPPPPHTHTHTTTTTTKLNVCTACIRWCCLAAAMLSGAEWLLCRT